MTALNPIGQHLQRMHSPDENWVIDNCQKSKFTTVTVLNAAALAGRIQSEGGVPYTIYRDTGFEPVPPVTDDAGIKAYAKTVYEQIRAKIGQTGNFSVHMMINCEQGASAHRVKMYTELMRCAVNDPMTPLGMVFCNASVGSIRTGFWGQDNEYARPEWIEFLRTFDQYRNERLPSGAYAFVLGVHNYSSQYPWIACNAGEHRIPTWDEANKIKIDWSKAQDHIGREYQGIRKALGYTWNNAARSWVTSPATLRRADSTPVEPPWIILTEMLIDDVGGVPIQATHIDGGDKPRGFNSLKTQYEQYWFKPDPHGLTLAKFSEWTFRVILLPEGYFIGGNNFCEGDTGGWTSFNTSPNGQPNMDYYNAVRVIRFDMPAHFFMATSVQPKPTQPPTNPPPPPTNPPPSETLPIKELVDFRRVIQLDTEAKLLLKNIRARDEANAADEKELDIIQGEIEALLDKWHQVA